MNKKFLLDTCALSALKQPSANHHRQYVSKLSSLDDSDQLYISMISLYEMEYGARHIRDKYPEMALEMKLAIQSVKDEFIILNLSHKGASIFADIKEQYQTKKGIGKKALIRHNADFMIVATAIEAGAILVTNDTKDQIPEIIQSFRNDFDWEDWTK
jgi:predicted nucleic acid-binding protein